MQETCESIRFNARNSPKMSSICNKLSCCANFLRSRIHWEEGGDALTVRVQLK